MRTLRNRMVTVAVRAVLALLLAIATLGFGFAALYMALATILSPAAAALAAAGVALGLALATIAAGRHITRSHGRTRNARPAQCHPDRVAAELGLELAQEATSFATAHPHLSVAGCLLLGYALGADPKLRTAVQDMIEML